MPLLDDHSSAPSHGCVVCVAEVTRTLVLEGVNAGPVEVSVPNLSQWINGDSVRVKGTGKATILEVAFQADYKLPTAGDDVSETETQRRVQALKDRRTEVEAAILDLSKQQEVAQSAQSLLDSYDAPCAVLRNTMQGVKAVVGVGGC